MWPTPWHLLGALITSPVPYTAVPSDMPAVDTPAHTVKATSAASTDTTATSTALLPYYSFSSSQTFTAMYLPMCRVSSIPLLKPSSHILTIPHVVLPTPRVPLTAFLQPMQPEVYAAPHSHTTDRSSNVPALLLQAESVPTGINQNSKAETSTTHQLVSLVLLPRSEFCLPLDALNQGATFRSNNSLVDLADVHSLPVVIAAAAPPLTKGVILDSLICCLAATVDCLAVLLQVRK